jgi:predicted transcriptional regulator
MRTLVDIEEGDIARLDELAAQQKRSRASLIRQAIANFLGQERLQARADAFGLWGKRRIDGLTYQQKARAEW